MNNQRIELGPCQESVWDYPRPPRIEETAWQVKVVFNGEVIADTRRAKRVLETSHPPVYYIPPEDIPMECLIKMSRRTWCELERAGELMRPKRREPASERCCLVLPKPGARLRGYPRTRGLLPGKDGCPLRGW
jgi:hypothetical protein